MVGDRSIPRHRAGIGIGTLQLGFFRRSGNETLLVVGEQTATYPIERVSMVMGAFGGLEDGVSVLPRAQQYDEQGHVTVPGDIVLVGYLGDDPRRPVVLGAVSPSPRQDGLVARPGRDTDPNTLRAVFRPRDDDNALSGRVQLDVADANEGRVSLATSHDITVSSETTITIKVVDTDGNQKAAIIIENGEITIQAPSVVVKNNGATDKLAQQAALDRIAGMFGTVSSAMAAIPFVPPPSFAADIIALQSGGDSTSVLVAE